MKIKLDTTCPSCGKTNYVTVDLEHYARWIKGELIQTALSELTASEREQLITGMCEDCWKKLMIDEI